jgi:hypothetical protein
VTTHSWCIEAFQDINTNQKEEFDIQVVALAEWLRRVPAKYMGFPRKSSNLLGDGIHIDDATNHFFLPF